MADRDHRADQERYELAARLSNREVAAALAVRDYGGPTFAASVLGVTKSTISRSINKLQRDLGGVDIFIREGQRVMPNADPSAAVIWRELDLIGRSLEVIRQCADGDPGSVPPIRVAANPAHVAVVAQAIAHRKTIEQVTRVRLEHSVEANRDRLGESLLDFFVGRHAEVAVLRRPARGERGLPGEGFPFLRWSLMVLPASGPAGDPLREMDMVPLTRLTHQPLLVSPPDHLSRSMVDQLANGVGGQLSIFYASESFDALVRLQSSGFGHLIVPSDALTLDQLVVARPITVKGRRKGGAYQVRYQSEVEYRYGTDATRVFIELKRFARRLSDVGRDHEKAMLTVLPNLFG